MSLRALIEISIHLESFRNIDLYFQGIYYARLKLFHKKKKQPSQPQTLDSTQAPVEEQIELAQPYCNFVSHVQEQKQMKMKTLKQTDHHSLLPAKIEDDQQYFLTKAFLIRYCEEEVELHDIVLFRAEIDVETDYLNTEFFLECELFFSDLSNLGGPEKWQEHIQDFESQAVFKQVQSQLYSIKRLPQGICEFAPLTFQDQYFSMLAVQVQSVLIDYRFRLKPLSAVKQVTKTVQKRQTLGESKYKESTGIVLGQGLPFVCQTVAEYFFADAKGNLPGEPNLREVDSIFSGYMRVIIAMYEKLRMTYNSFVNKFLTNEQRKELQLFAENQSIHDNAQEETKSEGSSDSLSEQKSNIPPTTIIRAQPSQKLLSKRILDGEIKCDIKNIQSISTVILTELNFLAGKTLILYHKMIEVVKVTPRFVSEYLQVEYEAKTRERWMESILRHVSVTHNFALLPIEEQNGEEIGEKHKAMARLKRKAASQAQDILKNEMLGIDLKIQATGILQELVEFQPIVFEECFVIETDPKFVQMVKQSQEITEQKILESLNINQKARNNGNAVGVHLFVMCHGFQGNHGDMRLFRNQIALLYPDSVILLSTSNEEQTEGDIFEMGERLATEVRQYILSFCPASCLAKLSFIGHSLGGLIIRAALPHLAEYSSKFYTYISLSSPHLGYMYNSNKLLDAGMWVIKNWKKSKCMSQLAMTDESKPEETCLFRLTQLPGFEWFKNIVLCCSFQDKYVPFDSARIQICKQALDATKDSKLGNTYIQMASNLLGNLPIKMVYRLDVNFHITDKNMDSWIGRTAHIQFLECQSLMKMLVYRYRDFFS